MHLVGQHTTFTRIIQVHWSQNCHMFLLIIFKDFIHIEEVNISFCAKIHESKFWKTRKQDLTFQKHSIARWLWFKVTISSISFRILVSLLENNLAKQWNRKQLMQSTSTPLHAKSMEGGRRCRFVQRNKRYCAEWCIFHDTVIKIL